MRTLPFALRKLIEEHPQAVRDALRHLRDPNVTEARICVAGKDDIVIRPLYPTTQSSKRVAS